MDRGPEDIGGATEIINRVQPRGSDRRWQTLAHLSMQEDGGGKRDAYHQPLKIMERTCCFSELTPLLLVWRGLHETNRDASAGRAVGPSARAVDDHGVCSRSQTNHCHVDLSYPSLYRNDVPLNFMGTSSSRSLRFIVTVGIVSVQDGQLRSSQLLLTFSKL